MVRKKTTTKSLKKVSAKKKKAAKKKAVKPQAVKAIRSALDRAVGGKKLSPKAKPPTAKKKAVKKKAAPKVKRKAPEKKKAVKKKLSRKKNEKKLNLLVSLKRPEKQVPAPPDYPQEIPNRYGDHFVYIIARDPEWIYSYWEIQGVKRDEALAKLGGKWDQVRVVLRTYDYSKSTHDFFDTDVDGEVNHWYLHGEPNHAYVTEVGLLHNDGRFVAIVRSNQITLPRDTMSEVIDDKWMSVDFEKMYELSGGKQVGSSSLELQNIMEWQLKELSASSSGAGFLSSLSSPVKPQQRKFWFWVDCELILYGATEPDAKVTLQGKPVQLRQDGSFSMRFALPDGKLQLDATAQSADGKEERTIIPIITRKTECPPPVIKS